MALGASPFGTPTNGSFVLRTEWRQAIELLLTPQHVFAVQTRVSSRPAAVLQFNRESSPLNTG